MSLPAIEKLLVGIESIFKTIQSNRSDAAMERAWEILVKEMHQYEALEVGEDEYGGHHPRPRQETIFINEVLLYSEHLLDLPMHNKAQNHIQTTCTAILKWCEQSLNRMD